MHWSQNVSAKQAKSNTAQNEGMDQWIGFRSKPMNFISIFRSSLIKKLVRRALNKQINIFQQEK